MAGRETRLESGRRSAAALVASTLSELRTARVTANLSQAAVAAKLGWPQTRYSLFERNAREATLTDVCLVASVLGLKLTLDLHRVTEGIRDAGSQPSADAAVDVRQAAGLLVLGGLIAAAYFIFGPAAAPTSPSPAQAEAAADTASATTTTTTTTQQDGQQLYINTCASCHGTTGQGTAVAPPLTGAGAAALDFYMRTGRMPLARLSTPPGQQTPVLSRAQIAAITVTISTGQK